MTPERLCWFQTGSNDSAFTCVSTARRSRATGPLHGRATNCAVPTAPQLRLAKFPFPVPPLLLSLSHHPGDALQGGKKKGVRVVFLYIFPPFFFPRVYFRAPRGQVRAASGPAHLPRPRLAPPAASPGRAEPSPRRPCRPPRSLPRARGSQGSAAMTTAAPPPRARSEKAAGNPGLAAAQVISCFF